MRAVRKILLAKTRRDLRRRLPQFAAIGVTVLIGVLLFVASYDAYRNLGSSYEHTYSRMHFADLTASGGDPAKVSAAVRGSEGVAAVTSRTQARLPVRLGGDELLGRVAGMPPAGGERAAGRGVNQVDVVSGDRPRDGDANGVLIERHTAETFGLSPGDTAKVFDGSGWRTLTVRGVADSPEYLWPALDRQQVIGDPHSFAVVFAPEATVRELAAGGGGSTRQTLVRLTDGARGDGDTAAAVTERLRSAGASPVEPRSQQPSHAALSEDLKGFSQLSVAFPLLFLSAAAVAAYVLITRLVLAERKIIATFLAAGVPRGTVARHYLGHGVLAGTGGAVLGVALGAAATTAVTHAYTSELGIPYTLVEHRPGVVLAGVLFGTLVGLVGGAAPAWATTRTAPAEAMRGDGGTLRPPGRWGRALAGMRRLPLTVRLSLRELGRSRRRTLATMLGSVLALVLVLTSAGMAASMRTAMDVQFEKVQREDATVTADPRAPDQQRALRGIDGVADVERVTTAQVTATAHGGSYSTSLTGYERGTSMHGFLTPEGRERELPPDGGLLAGKAVADRLGISPGDRFTLRTGGGEAKTVRLAGLLEEPMGSALYGTRGTVAKAIGPAAADTSAGTSAGASADTSEGYALRFAPGAPESVHDRVRQEATALDGVVAYAGSRALERQIDQYMALFRVFVGVMLFLGAVLALTVIYVTMTVNIAERTGELATLRATGVPLRRIAGLLAAENLAATLIALPFGLLAGFAAAWQFLESFNTDMFAMELRIGWPLALGAVGAVAGASLLSQIPAVRAVRRLDVARVVRERAG